MIFRDEALVRERDGDAELVGKSDQRLLGPRPAKPSPGEKHGA
jgi:hypothetical protein